MLPSLQKDDSVMESGRVTQAAGSADSSVGPSSTTSSTSTSPSSSISDAVMTIEHARETGFSCIIPELKQEEPASLHTSFSDTATPKPATPPSLAPAGSPKIEKLEKLEISSPIPLSRLFDFDKEDQESDKIVLNESERQYQQKLKDEFDAGFQDIKDRVGGELARQEGLTTGTAGNMMNGHTSNGKTYDSDEEEIRIDDDDDEVDAQRERNYKSKNSLPPPPPPPIGPPSIKHLPSALFEAQSSYQQIEHNIYRDRDPRWKACGPDCINRNLLVECIEDDCPCGSYCLNRRFQMKQNADVDVVKTEKKGFGLRAMEGLAPGTFVMEYIGEVLPHSSFVKRTREYSQMGVEHFYFMSLQSDEVIDATKKGCLARFINHSCNPNCHLEKWVVGSKLRIGIFTIKRVGEGEELTFDYQFERYGAEAQKCYCGEPNCTGFIGGNKRSSATRLDNYNSLDEVEDEDEIDLENQMSLRHPKKDKGNDGDYEDEYEEKKSTRGIEDPILMEKLARIMFMKPKVQKSKRLLAKLMATTERACLRRFLVLHGLVILKAWLKHYKDEPDIIMGIMHVLPSIPLLSRNAIEDSQIEEAVQEVADGPECPSKGMAQDVLTQWKELKPTYRIPKAKKLLVPATTEAVGTPTEESSTFMSPAESNGSGSVEGLGKRQYEDEERASTPAGMEKRGKFDLPPTHTPQDENEAAAAAEASYRYHNYSYDSADYASRSESHRPLEPYGRIGDGYGRDGRDGYGRVDLYGRMEPHSREGSYGRSGESGYSRSDSYGRMDPYGISKAGYERGRYEHYRSERDRERDRYYDYYRERDYDRDYRSHRDPRDMRDMRDPRDPRDYREPRDSYSHAPMSPRPRDRDLSPGGLAPRDRSPSTSSRRESWAGDGSRSISPSRERGSQQPEPSQSQGEMAKAAALGSDQEHRLPTAIVGNQPLPVDGPPARSPVAIGSASDNPVAQTSLQNHSLPADQPESSSSLPPTEQSTPAAASVATSSSPHHANGYPYRSTGGHGDYPHSRYSSHSGGYHHAPYYRHSSSSNYPHYAKPHHYRSASSRPYSSSSNYPPTVELPPNWSKASDPEGRIYYYNEITRATQWEPPRAEPAAAAPSEAIPQAPTSHSQQPHMQPQHLYHSQPQPQSLLRPPSPEPPKPVNIDGFTQEQLQEVIGRAYDKQKQKNLANGIGSAGASVHDVDSPSTARPNSGRPLKSMNEKDLKNAISGAVVKNMAKYKIKLGSSDAFKKHARRITHLIADKEMRSKTFKAGELSEITPVMKNKIRRFVKDYMTKLFKKQPKEERSSLSSSTAALVNGSRTSISHVIVLGADGTVAPTLGSGAALFKDTLSVKKDFGPSTVLSSKLGTDKKSAMSYGDVEVDDDDDVKYGEGEDGDEDEGDLDGDDDDDEGGVAAVPSSSVELPL
ncbi:histone methyltransferase set2 [Mortierella sp. GBA30]|nr:histone methyltransferase set2 [Mortierella sp. GBA30]